VIINLKIENLNIEILKDSGRLAIPKFLNLSIIKFLNKKA